MKTLREMTWEEAGPIYRAWHAGEPLQFFVNGQWLAKLNREGLNPNRAYRPKPKHKPTFAHWAALEKRIRFITRDVDGHIGGFEYRPEASNNIWIAGGSSLSLNHLTGFDWGDLPLQDCIIERPEGE